MYFYGYVKNIYGEVRRDTILARQWRCPDCQVAHGPEWQMEQMVQLEPDTPQLYKAVYPDLAKRSRPSPPDIYHNGNPIFIPLFGRNRLLFLGILRSLRSDPLEASQEETGWVIKLRG